MTQHSLTARRSSSSRFSREIFLAFHEIPKDQKLQLIEMLIQMSPRGDLERISVLRRAKERASREVGVN